jgi:hypothetical protein
MRFVRNHMGVKAIILLILSAALFSCGAPDVLSDPARTLRKFKDKKIVSVFPSEPEMLPIEDVFFGEGIGIKRTYLAQESDSTAYIVSNFTTKEYNGNRIDSAIEEFKELYMISHMDSLSDRGLKYSNCYLATSELSNIHYYVKFALGTTSNDVFYATSTCIGTYPDSATSMFFLNHSSRSDY